MADLNTKIAELSRVGKVTARLLGALDIKTVEDLLFYFPFRYEDFSRITMIEEIEPMANVNIVGQIELISNKRSRKRRMFITEALVSDDTGRIKAIWFNQPFIARNLKTGDMVSLAGKAEDQYEGLVMKSPVYEKLTRSGPLHTQGVVPVYHLTAGLTQKQVRFLINQVLPVAGKIKDWLPDDIIKNKDLLPLHEAVKKIHFPGDARDIEKARRRLAFNELFLSQLQSQIIKQNLKSGRSTNVAFKEKETKEFVDNLPFKLTDHQKRAAWEIIRDISSDQPMARLLEGDVGSGKTMVAVLAVLNTMLNGKQSVFMAPTEILAQQHYKSFWSYFAGYKYKIALLTGGDRRIYDCEKKKETLKAKKSDVLEMLKNGELALAVGTHALIQDPVLFKDLALAIIDEQHRFGVEQRKKLTKKSGCEKTIPHLLSMTATPIPRSLALTLYGELDLSIIREMPLGRKPIITSVIPESKRTQAYEFIRKMVKEGRQVFVICPLIDLSDKSGSKSVKQEYLKLDKGIFPEYSIGLLHGKMKTSEKEEIMDKFARNEIQVLVSTSVIEVGVDIPNATIMMIEDADRFGLAQLHQFRGRVGRGRHQSYCFLFTENGTETTLERLNALTKHNNGFDLAKIDLKYRGPGEIFGKAQKGFPEFKVADLFDYALIKEAQEEAASLLEDPENLRKNPLLSEKIKEWEDIHLE